jgi:hypothetical protein
MGFYGYDPATYAKMKVGIMQNMSSQVGQSLQNIGKDVGNIVQSFSDADKQEKVDAAQYQKAEQLRDTLAKTVGYAKETLKDQPEWKQALSKMGVSTGTELVPFPPKDDPEALKNYMEMANNQLSSAVMTMRRSKYFNSTTYDSLVGLPGFSADIIKYMNEQSTKAQEGEKTVQAGQLTSQLTRPQQIPGTPDQTATLPSPNDRLGMPQSQLKMFGTEPSVEPPSAQTPLELKSQLMERGISEPVAGKQGALYSGQQKEAGIQGRAQESLEYKWATLNKGEQDQEIARAKLELAKWVASLNERRLTSDEIYKADDAARNWEKVLTLKQKEVVDLKSAMKGRLDPMTQKTIPPDPMEKSRIEKALLDLNQEIETIKSDRDYQRIKAYGGQYNMVEDKDTDIDMPPEPGTQAGGTAQPLKVGRFTVQVE